MAQSILRRLAPAAVLTVAVLAAALAPEDASAQGKKSDSQVKVTAKADKIDSDGNQVVTVTLDINKGWHLYANPVDNADLVPSQVVVTVTGKTKPEDVKVVYPAGKQVKDKVVGDYKVYEGKVDIKATVKRAKGDTAPLEVNVKLQACDDSKCLLPATVKVAVP